MNASKTVIASDSTDPRKDMSTAMRKVLRKPADEVKHASTKSVLPLIVFTMISGGF